MNNRFSQLISVVSVFVVLSITFSVGYFIGVQQESEIERVEALRNKTEDMPGTVDFSAYWRAWNVIDENYVPVSSSTASSSSEMSQASAEEKVWGSIKGLAESLGDPYTVFLPPQDSKTFAEDISGKFEGVGMEIGVRDDVLTVIAPLEGTPAQRAGLQSQDRIIEIDGVPTQGMTVDEAVQRIRGERGTSVVFTILRNGEDEPHSISVTRDRIRIPTIDTTLRSDGVFIIKLHNFSEQSAILFRQAMKEFSRSGSTDLVLDLRQNPGGFLRKAVEIAGHFLPEGSVVVREESSLQRSDHTYRSPGYTVDTSQFDMVVLVDGGSASASEILAAALAEHGVATLVGSQTFGKGSVQDLIDITTDPKTSLKITIARWLTPNGKSISQGGLTPEIEVERTREEFQRGEDPQLDAAVELLVE